MNNDQNIIIEKLRAQYTRQEATGLDTLKALDARVKRPAYIFGYVFGTLSALVMGTGMSLVMTELPELLHLANSRPIGIAIGVVGLGMALLNYPIFKGIMSRRRKKFAPQIMELSQQLLVQ